MGERDDYKFLKIKDAISAINQKVNLIGVVIELGFPKTTRGTGRTYGRYQKINFFMVGGRLMNFSNYFCSVKIVDESYPKPGIPVNFFMAHMENLPTVGSPGDIIQLSRVVMKTHNDGVYALFNKKFSSFALYEGKNGVNTFSFLREMREGQHANLVCKILHVCEIAKNEWMALVWDGTDSPPISINTNPEHKMDEQLPLQLEPSPPLSRDLLCTFPTVGTILRVIIDKVNQKHVLHLLNTGEWVKFISILCEVHAGLWCGVLTPFTKLRYLSNEDHFVLACQRSYNERVSLKLGRIPYWCFPWCSQITEVDYDHMPFVTLMDVLTYSEATARFKCIIRVVAAFPWRAEDFSHHGTYRIRLTIEDPTARIHAFIYAEDGEKFFDGNPSIDVLTRKRDKLLGVAANNDVKGTNPASRNPPWVQCCLKSYYLDKNDIWGSRQYRIFGTKLAD
ncbi:protection of telomeres protein 1a isoform X4 [Populus alba]|uniref:protection of telomeres protein 1a isoform X4 n=1 Tax=Populus alba TaxID=43335 RepID=UPI00158854C3|nr:protection of telomeres protein 1a-like isoform X4 [Populus alba]